MFARSVAVAADLSCVCGYLTRRVRVRHLAETKDCREFSKSRSIPNRFAILLFYSLIFAYLPTVFLFYPFPSPFRATRATRDRERCEKLTDRKDNKKRDNKKKERLEDGELFLSFTCRDFLRENISTRQQQAGTISTRKSIYTDRFPRL